MAQRLLSSQFLISTNRCIKVLCSTHNVLPKPMSTCYSTEVLRQPEADGAVKQYPPKIRNIVSDISKLTLLEVADLNELLKDTLKIKDAPMAVYSAAAAATPAEEEEEKQETSVKTSFTVKLVKYDETKKVPLIKEIKTLIEGLNLVQSKKFVENLPQVVRADVGKKEADELVEKIKAAGGTCEIE